jgi:integrase
MRGVKEMAKRRGNKEGSIHQRDNGTWRAQVTVDGRRLSFSSKTRHEVQVWLKKTTVEIDEGMTYESTKLTFNEYLNGWLSSKKSFLQPATWTHYNQLSKKYIIPAIGSTKIRSLTPWLIQDLYDRLLASGVGTQTVIKIHTVLQSALNHAAKTGIMSSNPASTVIPPKVPFREMETFNESQVSSMLIAAKGNRFQALYQLAVTTGMRQMELLGLKWSDIDWSRQTLRVERQLVRPDGEGIKFSHPKTNYGRWEIALGSQTIEVLRDHYERQQTEINVAGDNWIEQGLVFTNSFRGPLHPRNLLRDFKKFLKNASLPLIRFHDLRHTAASLMLNHGIPLIIASRRLGHARASITLDMYGHMIPNMQVEAAEKLDELVTPIELHPIAPELHQEHTYAQSATINTPTGGHL